MSHARAITITRRPLLLAIPARYSFTYVKDGNDWKIVDSSAMPRTEVSGRA